jgi:hypothetical protein
MIRISTITLFVLAASSGQALAAGAFSSNPPTMSQVCLDVSGQTLPVVCKVPASRLDKREDICQCPEGRLVDVPICAPGQRPPPDSRALSKVRRVAGKDGSLVGDQFAGKPICVAPRAP